MFSHPRVQPWFQKAHSLTSTRWQEQNTVRWLFLKINYYNTNKSASSRVSHTCVCCNQPRKDCFCYSHKEWKKSLQLPWKPFLFCHSLYLHIQIFILELYELGGKVLFLLKRPSHLREGLLKVLDRQAIHSSSLQACPCWQESVTAGWKESPTALRGLKPSLLGHCSML